MTGVFFVAVRRSTGADEYVKNVVSGLLDIGVQADVAWLPSYAEYLPWFVRAPRVPDWADVLHVNSWLHPKFDRCKLPSVVTFHHSVFSGSYNRHKGMLQRLYHRFWVAKNELYWIKNAKIIHAVSESTKKDLARDYGVESVAVIYNWVGVSSKKDKVPPFPGERVSLLFVGRPNLRKGFDIALEVAKELGNGFSLVCNCLRGDVPSTLVAPPNVIFVGRQASNCMNALYDSAHILLAPSRLEGFGLSVVEAQHRSLPVVVAGCSALPEVVLDGESGFVCSSVEEYVNAIRELVSDEKLYARCSSAAYKYSILKFNKKDLLEKYRVLYESCAQE